MASKRLLAVLAHPDDETFGFGGTLALYATRGVEVRLVCATRGEAGTVAPEFLQEHDSVAALREAELRCAADRLGLAGVHLLDYRDSGMIGSSDNDHPRALVQAPKEKLVAQIVSVIRHFKPQVVMTHNPAGDYGHPDHLAMHQATLEAFQAAGQRDASASPFIPQKLYYSTFSLSYLRMLITLARLIGRDPTRWGRNQDIDLTELTQDRFPTHAKINFRSVAKAKRRAFACHASQLQMGPSMRGLTGLLVRFNRLRPLELFMRAHPAVTSPRPERDLFSGVELEPGL